MKKLFKVLVICCLSVFMFGACESGSYNKNSSTKVNDMNYQKACEELDFGKAHEILNKLRDVFVNKGLQKSRYSLVSELKGYNEYVDADVYIFREEVTYLMSLDDPAAENRIVKLIMETPLDGRALDEGYCDHNDASEKAVTGGENVWLYCYCIKRNNQKCDIAMDLAILHGNQTLAKKVLLYYKDNMHIEQGGTTSSMEIKGEQIVVTHSRGYIWYDSSDKDAAQKRYDEAVKNGVFK